MSVYLHIPFCRQACSYCNFHFSTSLRYKDVLLEAMKKEIEIKKDYLQGQSLKSVYFGGGTPSLLSIAEINDLLETISRYHHIETNAEITLEANPDDLSKAYLSDLRNTAVNRLSIGVQSFFDQDLVYMNRKHNASESMACLEYAASLGWNTLSIDLIYGVPTMNDKQWAENIRLANESGANHISCYCLTVEPKTPLDKSIKKGGTSAPNDSASANQFVMLMDFAEQNGWEHYEISNFCKQGQYAVHNTSYWQWKPYLGIGPSAHSFDGKNIRQWNLPNNNQYIRSLEAGNLCFESEDLSLENIFNEYIMLSLRTQWGMSVSKATELAREAGANNWSEELNQWLDSPYMIQNGDIVKLTKAGKLQADGIAGSLFLVPD